MADNKDHASELEYSEHVCLICRVNLYDDTNRDDWTTLTAKGLTTLLQFSVLYGKNDLVQYLSAQPEVVNVHVLCRQRFTSKRRYEQQCRRASTKDGDVRNESNNLESSASPFEFKGHCFLCARPAAVNPRRPIISKNISHVRPGYLIRNKMLSVCDERMDEWSMEVFKRIEICIDLHRAEAVYHRSCYRDFTSRRSDPSKMSPAAVSRRHVDHGMNDAFVKMCDWLENAEYRLYTLTELHARMFEYRDDVYCKQQLKHKLEEKYGDHLVISKSSGRGNVVRLCNMASYGINDQWYHDRESNIEDESRRIVETAAKMIKASIRENDNKNDAYSSTYDVNHLLQTFLKHLISDDLQQTAVGHFIMQAIRPQSMKSHILTTSAEKQEEQIQEESKEIILNSKPEQNISFINCSNVGKASQRYLCEVCSELFVDKRNLHRHMRIHSGEKLFGCHVCGESFMQKHMMSHSKEKKFLCEVCSKSFVQNSHLIRHMRIHSGEKVSGCYICGKMFTQKCVLKMHMLSHSKEKPFLCEVCSQSLRTKFLSRRTC